MTGIETQQILLPKKVYIGDTAELRCTFNSNSLYLKNFTATDGVPLSINAFEAPIDSQNYNIQKITISSVGVDYYQLSITFVPWKTGRIQLPPYNISANFDNTNPLTSSTLTDQLEVAFEPVNIVSIVEQNQVTGLSPSAPPMLLPGTTYKLYSVLILFIVLILFFIRSITRREQLAFYIRSKKLLWKYKKNRKLALKALDALLKPDSKKVPQKNDKEFAQSIQQILRNYLEVRFDYPFSKTVTSSFMNAFHTIFGGTEDFSSLMTEQKENACLKMTSLFTRTDFIRYSNLPELSSAEREDIINEAEEAILELEGEATSGQEAQQEVQSEQNVENTEAENV